MTTSCLPWHRSNMMIVIWPTKLVKHILETSGVLLNAVQIDAAQDRQMFSQFYLYSRLHNTNFIKWTVLFPKKYMYEVLLECASLSCTFLTMLFAAEPRARMVLLSRFQSCFSLDEYQSEQIDKGQYSETLFRRNEGQSVARQQVLCSASSNGNTMTCSA